MLKEIFNLRYVIAIVICLASSATMFAQDVIILRNGVEVQAIVEEIGIENVRYRRADNLSGPIRVVSRSEILMIEFENGTREIFYETAPAIERPALTHSFGRPISPYGSERNPFLAGFLSFMIPGLGQFYNGDIGAGWLFLGSHILCSAIWLNSIDWIGLIEISYGEDVPINQTQFFIGFLGTMTVYIWSIVHAAQGAQRVNAVRGFRVAGNTYFNIQPTLIRSNYSTNNQRHTHGLSFSLNF